MDAAVRRATAGDAAAIAGLLQELGYELPAADVQSRLSGGDESVWVAVGTGDVLGLVAVAVQRHLTHAQPLARITAMVVARRARRAGVGRLLMTHAAAEALSAGCVGVELTTALRPDRVAAHAFYEALGYVRTSYRFFRPLPDAAARGDSGTAAEDTFRQSPAVTGAERDEQT